MVKKGRSVLTGLAILVLVLVLANILLVLGNQSLQAEVNERQQTIAQAIQVEGLSRQVITLLANIAIKTNDQELKNLLASTGVTLSPGSEPAGGAK